MTASSHPTLHIFISPTKTHKVHTKSRTSTNQISQEYITSIVGLIWVVVVVSAKNSDLNTTAAMVFLTGWDLKPSIRSFEVQNIRRTPRNYFLQPTRNPYFQCQYSPGASHLSQFPPAVTVLSNRTASSPRISTVQTAPLARTKP